MSAALPYALRARFREYIEEGFSGRAAAARLKLSAATGVRWQRKLRETGTVSPEAQGRPPGHGKLAAHRVFLEDLLAQDGDITLPELAGALHAATEVVAQPELARERAPFAGVSCSAAQRGERLD